MSNDSGVLIVLFVVISCSFPRQCSASANSCPDLEPGQDMQLTGSCTNAKINDKCTILCLTGYNLVGPAEYTCKEDLDWDKMLSSKCVNSCPKMVPAPNMLLTGSCTNAKINDKCTISCLPGYKVFGTSEYTCKDDFEWDKPLLTKCVNSCPGLTPGSNMRLTGSCTNAQIADKCTISCLPGYKISGPAEYTCKDDFQWDKAVSTGCVSGAATIGSWLMTVVLVPALAAILTRS